MRKLTGLLLVLLCLAAVSSPSFASGDETCYQVSRMEGMWSKTPELLCIDPVNARANEYEITLRTGLAGISQKTVATFSLNLTSRARCMECNEDVYSVANPENSSFNALAIRFQGVVDNRATRTETGTVSVGATQFFYRSVRR